MHLLQIVQFDRHVIALENSLQKWKEQGGDSRHKLGDFSGLYPFRNYALLGHAHFVTKKCAFNNSEGSIYYPEIDKEQWYVKKQWYKITKN